MQLYVSESALVSDTADLSVEEIVSAAITKNRTLCVTGGLVFTGKYFAQVLEGAPDVVDGLMASIERDARHRQIRTVAKSMIAERRFATWDLAYAGPSRFVSSYITRIIDERTAALPAHSANWLISLIEEFAVINATR